MSLIHKRTVEIVGEMLQSVGRTDSNETNITARKLEYVRQKTYEMKYQQYKARTLMPVTNDVPPGATHLITEVMDWVGEAKIQANHADDIPYVDTTHAEMSTKIYRIVDGYRYSVEDLERAAFSRVDLEGHRAMAARKAIETKLDRVGAIGDANWGIPGLFTQSSVTIIPATGAAWTGATTADNMLADMNGVVNPIAAASRDTFAGRILVMPIEQYQLAAEKQRAAGTDTTVLNFFLAVNPYIERVIPWSYADGAGAGGVDRMVAYDLSEEVLEFCIPQEFRQEAPEKENYAYKVPCSARVAGVIVRYPVAMRYMDGI